MSIDKATCKTLSLLGGFIFFRGFVEIDDSLLENLFLSPIESCFKSGSSESVQSSTRHFISFIRIHLKHSTTASVFLAKERRSHIFKFAFPPRCRKTKEQLN